MLRLISHVPLCAAPLYDVFISTDCGLIEGFSDLCGAQPHLKRKAWCIITTYLKLHPGVLQL